MKKFALIALLVLPVSAFGASWSYYVLSEGGNWEPVSPRDLDLSLPAAGAAGQQRVMILHNQPKPQRKGRQTQSWIRQVSRDLVEQVE